MPVAVDVDEHADSCYQVGFVDQEIMPVLDVTQDVKILLESCLLDNAYPPCLLATILVETPG